jgi:hypothetical protein
LSGVNLAPFMSVPRHDCDCCGAGSHTEFFDSLQLYICSLCAMPSNDRATDIEWKAWRATMRFAAGMRELNKLQGEKVSVWFIERYERLGLKR